MLDISRAVGTKGDPCVLEGGHNKLTQAHKVMVQAAAQEILDKRAKAHAAGQDGDQWLEKTKEERRGNASA